MNFSILTPLPPRTQVAHRGGGVGGGGWGWGSGGGVKTSFRIAAAVCGFGPGSRTTFFLDMDPLTYGGGPWSELRVPPPHHGPLPVRT